MRTSEFKPWSVLPHLCKSPLLSPVPKEKRIPSDLKLATFFEYLRRHPKSPDGESVKCFSPKAGGGD